MAARGGRPTTSGWGKNRPPRSSRRNDGSRYNAGARSSWDDVRGSAFVASSRSGMTGTVGSHDDGVARSSQVQEVEESAAFDRNTDGDVSDIASTAFPTPSDVLKALGSSPSPQTQAQSAEGAEEQAAGLTSQAPPSSASPSPWPVGGLRRNRLAWADMASDTESDLDGGSQGSAAPAIGTIGKDKLPPSPSASSAGAAPSSLPSPTSGGCTVSHSGSWAPRLDGGPGAGGVDVAAMWWGSEVEALAQRLKLLATLASPSWTTEPRSATSSTTPAAATQPDVSVTAAQKKLADIREEIERLKNESKTAKSTAISSLSEQRAAEAAVISAATAVREEAARLRIAAAQDAAAKAECAAASRAAAKENSFKECKTRLDALRQALHLEKVAAEAAVAECAAAEVEMKERRAAMEADVAENLPAALEKHRTNSERVIELEEACSRLNGPIEALRAELSAAAQGAGSASRAATLEARVSQLERECRDIQEDTTVSATNSQDAAPPLTDPSVMEDLAGAKDRNLGLLTEVRQARAARDAEAQALSDRQRDIDNLKSNISFYQGEHSSLTEHLTAINLEKSQLQDQVDQWRSTLQEKQAEVAEAERAAVSMRERRQEIDAAIRGLVLARRRAEETEALRDHQLRKAVSHLLKERKGDPLIKCLQSDRLGMSRPTGGHWSSSVSRTRRGQTNDCQSGDCDDARSTEVSTVAGDESVAECGGF